jgi:hypothetical protein
MCVAIIQAKAACVQQFVSGRAGVWSEVQASRVKALSTVKSGDFKGLKHLSNLLGDRFLRGIVLYTGDQPVPFGSNLYALPVSTLWRTGEMHHEKSKDKT